MNPNYHPPLYKLRVFTHAGAFRHELILDGLSGLSDGQRPLLLTGGPTFEVRPGGDCRQASFEAVGAHLDIHYEDLVELWWSDDGGDTWAARWAGYADTVAGARNPDPDGYVLYGLRQRLDRVEVRDRVPQDFPNRQWIAMLNAVIASGQLGQALQVLPLPAGVGSVRPAIEPRYESVMQIADKWLVAELDDPTASLGDYGVNARREPIWGKPDGLHVFDEADGVIITSKAGSSAGLRTHVRVTWAKPGLGPYAVFGSPILTEQQGAQTTLLVPVADPDAYGFSVRRELMKPLPQYFTRAPCQGVRADWISGNPLAVNTGMLVLPATCTGDVNTLNDTNPGTGVTVALTGNPASATPGGTYRVEVTYPPGPVPWGVVAQVTGGTITGFVFDGALDVRCPPPDGSGLLLFPDEVRDWIARHWDPAVTSRIEVHVARSGTGSVQVTTFGALFLDEAAVRRDVMRLAHLPTPNPETIRVPGWAVEPLAFVTCIYRHPDGTEAGRAEGRRADVYRYVVDDDGEAWTEVSVGQADDADDVAAASLTDRRVVRAAQQAALGST